MHLKKFEQNTGTRVIIITVYRRDGFVISSVIRRVTQDRQAKAAIGP